MMDKFAEDDRIEQMNAQASKAERALFPLSFFLCRSYFLSLPLSLSLPL